MLGCICWFVLLGVLGYVVYVVGNSFDLVLYLFGLCLVSMVVWVWIVGCGAGLRRLLCSVGFGPCNGCGDLCFMSCGV